MLVFFFFQAEDGIRDGTVTVVQTCALPIYCGAHTFPYVEVKNQSATVEHEASTSKISDEQLFYRSEERRVGKSVNLGGRRSIKKKKKTKTKRTAKPKKAAKPDMTQERVQR